MKKLIALFLLVQVAAGMRAQFVPTDTLRFRISLKDKAATHYSLSRPEQFLSAKAIIRRERQKLPIDSTDLPVCREYIETIRQKGVHVLLAGKWENFVTVSCNDPRKMEVIRRLPFVKRVEQVWKGKMKKSDKRVARTGATPECKDDVYGTAARQIKMSRGNLLHDEGFRGMGMTIAVIDAGFHNVDSIADMENIKVLGTCDFVNPQADIYMEGTHGTSVLSCMAMNVPYKMIGTAPEAEYWLLRSEDEASENLVEQDYWAAAVEFADSVGADVINTSLGYYAFDDSTKNYQLRDLTGAYALISRQASRVADKGMVLVCSAGNSGDEPWKKITPPGDADNVLTVGAVDKAGRLASFSSVGNTADGRIKPDVVAVGRAATVMGAAGTLRQANGTSFASPVMCGMVACLWQACPQLTAKELIRLVRSAGDRAAYPDNIYGYGVPDMWKAYRSTIESDND